MKALQTPENEGATKKLPFVGDGESKSLPKLNDPWPELSACEAFLNANEFSLGKFHEAARRGGHAKFATNYSLGNLTPMPHIRGVMRAAQILRMELEVKSRLGDPRGAAEAMRALLCLHRFLNHEPSLVGFMVRNAVDGVATGALPDKLCVTPFTEEELREFQQLARANEPSKCLRMALVGERAIGNTVLNNPDQLGEERPATEPLNGDKASYLLLMNDLIWALDQDYPDCFDAYARVEQEQARKSRTWAAKWTMAYTLALMPQAYQNQVQAARALARLRALDAAIAVELFRRETGALPDSLKALVPKYLPAPPLDPCTGNELKYEKLENAFQFRSEGLNGGQSSMALNLGMEIVVFPIAPSADPPKKKSLENSP